MGVFWKAAPHSLIENDRHFREAYCFHHLGDSGRFGGAKWWNVSDKLERTWKEAV
jgi:hypothetical protein